jgi:hypothetical protein
MLPCAMAHGNMTVRINPQRPELKSSEQRCLMRFFTGDFAFWTVYFVNVGVKNQQMQQLLIQFINYMFRHYIAILGERS